MIPLTPAALAQVVGGTLHTAATGPQEVGPKVEVTGPVVTDSRQVAPGGLFVALPGEQADGHDFVAVAADAGAAASLVARPVRGPSGAPAGTQVEVPDVQLAFDALARWVLRARGHEMTVVAVTGSAGKTSTKDLLAALLAEAGPVVAAPGSYNSETGVPLTVCRAQADTRHLVVEMGARGPGHIAHLTTVAPPDVAVVLNVGSAHLGEFGSVDAVEAAKGELPAALGPAGIAVLNLDDERVARMASRTAGTVVGFRASGSATGAQVWAGDVDLDPTGRAVFVLHSTLGGGGAQQPEQAEVHLRLVGEHHVANAVAAAAVALLRGVPLPRVAEVLGRTGPASRWRMEVTDRPDGVTVVNDAYNANPESARAALKALVAMRRGADGTQRRTWAVLGEMLELGDASVREHDLLGRLAVRLNVSRLLAVGPGALAVHSGAQHEGSWGEESLHVPDAGTALALLREELRPGDVVLVKSSNAAGLRHLGDALVADVPPVAEDGSGERP